MELGNRLWTLEIPLLLASGALLMIGYVMVVSASMHLGDIAGGHTFRYPLRHLVHILAGLLGAALMMFVPLARLEKAGQWLFLVGLALLVAVLIPGLGVKVNGSIRWLSLGGTRIQVSEIVKLISVIYMAGYMTRHVQTVRTSVYGMVRPLMLLSFAGFLLLLEPDFGAAAVILITALALMFLGGARLWQFAVLVCLIGVLGMILIVCSPERMERLTTFTNPWADPLDSGFQLTQSLIAFGRGEWFGVGLGSGLQKLYYLPEGHTDFLFAVIGEELGLAGVSVVIALFAFLIWKAFWIARIADQVGFEFAAYLAYGLGIWFGVQSAINMGVNMGMLPTKGLTLPLMSYGGGSMIVMCLAIGLLFRVYHEALEQSRSGARGFWNG
ncbi:MAG: putative lipid II flippase FtsW [Methylococcaceae bacterium]|nr:putative lipid II flippase FtsW [Methylococcaceae bacterium]MCI0734144.1 putative lipid II flippase FtsW [Methylococcaceae bacterium]